MLRFLKRLSGSEKGQALPIVLALLAIGGLTIAVNLNYVTICLKSSRIVAEDVKGIYAASAGIENTLWSLKNGVTPPTQLSQTVNQMAVAIQTLGHGYFYLSNGNLEAFNEGQHANWIDVTSTITPTGISGKYKYTITITKLPDCALNKKLTEVGARLPIGYSYVSGSAASFPSNLSTSNPVNPIITDSVGACMPKWTLPNTPITSIQTQSFYITGSSGLEGEYAWVCGQSNDIGTVSEITGTRCIITAIATRPEDGKTTAKIVAEAIMNDDGAVNVVSWQIAK